LLKKIHPQRAFGTIYWTAFLLQKLIVIFLGKCEKRLNAHFNFFVSRSDVVSHTFTKKKYCHVLIYRMAHLSRNMYAMKIAPLQGKNHFL